MKENKPASVTTIFSLGADGQRQAGARPHRHLDRLEQAISKRQMFWQDSGAGQPNLILEMSHMPFLSNELMKLEEDLSGHLLSRMRINCFRAEEYAPDCFNYQLGFQTNRDITDRVVDKMMEPAFNMMMHNYGVYNLYYDGYNYLINACVNKYSRSGPKGH